MQTVKKQLMKKIKFHYEMELVTGLRIGAARESTEIGGVDNPVVRNPITKEPYIPGSSLKGKMRCLLQQAKGEMGYEHPTNSKSIICSLFGAAGENGNASRIIVRDAFMTDETRDILRELDTDMPFTEVKAENSINRIKGTADSPRFMERIPAGSKFQVHFVVNIFEETLSDDKGNLTKIIDKETELLDLFNEAIKMLENDYLGGNGSRGYGQVKFTQISNPETLSYNTK
jgi:CRISPR-associated protein Csm3